MPLPRFAPEVLLEGGDTARLLSRWRKRATHRVHQPDISGTFAEELYWRRRRGVDLGLRPYGPEKPVPCRAVRERDRTTMALRW